MKSLTERRKMATAASVLVERLGEDAYEDEAAMLERCVHVGENLY